MRFPRFLILFFVIGTVLLFYAGCSQNYCTQKDEDYATIERIMNATWSSDDQQILKTTSLHESKDHYVIADWDPCGKNWRMRVEICNADLSSCQEVFILPEAEQGRGLGGRPLYWLPSIQKIITINGNLDSGMDEAIIMDINGTEQVLELPVTIVKEIFSGDIPHAGDIAPSPKEDVVAVYFWISYYPSLITRQCISFFDMNSMQHIYTHEIPLDDPTILNNLGQNNNRTCYFLWSKDGAGVYIVRHDAAYFIKYGKNAGITEVEYVPERGIITNSGSISNTGFQLLVSPYGYPSGLEIIQLDDWIPFDSLLLIPREKNTYSSL
jgi:hypothetical protein